jgi:hypothetical protein
MDITEDAILSIETIMNKKTLVNLYRKYMPLSIRKVRGRVVSIIKKTVVEHTKINPKTFKFQIEIHLVDHCNLKCANCFHFSCIADEYFYGVETYKKDCIQFSKLTGGGERIEEIRLLGGEPLLHPQIIDFMKITRQYFDDARIRIVTNGILLSKQTDAFWQCCKEDNIGISISRYPVNMDLVKIRALLEKYDIYCSQLEEDETRVKWGKMLFDLKGEQEINYNFKHCHTNKGCNVLRNGRLYPCEMIPNIHHFNKYFNQNLIVSDKDSIDIYNVKDIYEVIHFLMKPFPFCRYCIKGRMGKAEWHTSSIHNITEWT